jgi:hypothetical protein
VELLSALQNIFLLTDLIVSCEDEQDVGSGLFVCEFPFVKICCNRRSDKTLRSWHEGRSVKYAKGREIGRLNSDKFIGRNYETLASSEKTGIVRSGSAFPSTCHGGRSGLGSCRPIGFLGTSGSRHGFVG